MSNSCDANLTAKQVRHDLNRIVYGLEAAETMNREDEKSERKLLLANVEQELKALSQKVLAFIEGEING